MNLCWAVYAGLRDTRPMLDGEINEFYALDMSTADCSWTVAPGWSS